MTDQRGIKSLMENDKVLEYAYEYNRDENN